MDANPSCAGAQPSCDIVRQTSAAPAAPTTFDVGITTLTDVDAISRIAYDVRDMAESLERGDFLDARRIYEEGKHAPRYDRYGNEVDELLSLRSMSASGAGGRGAFGEDPTYLFHVLGLADGGEDAEVALAEHGTYADDRIVELLNDYGSGTLGAQASTVLVVSMYAAHQLWDGLLDCYAVYNGFNPEADETGKMNPKKSYDNFIALRGETSSGTVDAEGEAKVNADVKQLYQSIQRTLSEENYCTREDTLGWLWHLSNRIVAKMMIPMVQMLIHSMKQADQAPEVGVYARAVIPQLSQCRPSIHTKLKDYLIDKEYDSRDFDRILRLLQQSYDCLGFTCADVGAYKTTMVAECAGYGKDHPLASFVPKEDIRTLSKADLDILAMHQLLKFPSETNNLMAQMYYKFGRGVEVTENTELGDSRFATISLRDMARTTHKGMWSPYYNDYIEYFKRDKFDDVAILTAFENKEGVLRLHPDQRTAYLTSMMRYNIIPEYMMSLLGLALQVCRDDGNKKPAVVYWDAFAALYIGSLEGIEEAGSEDDGLLMWALANNRAQGFNTQNDEFRAIINEEMTDLMFAGQAQLERKDCPNFEKTASRVLHLMLVPLIQSTIWYAIHNEGKGVGSTHKDLVIGEVMAYSVLPIVSKYDVKAAAEIERNMIRSQGIAPVAEGPQVVANAFFKILDDIGWGCDYVGQADGTDTCELFDPHAHADYKEQKNTGSLPFAMSLLALSVGLALSVWGITSILELSTDWDFTAYLLSQFGPVVSYFEPSN